MGARHEELVKLFYDFVTFMWTSKARAKGRDLDPPKNYCWVDTKKLDEHKARFTCADYKKKGKKPDGKTFSPTPHEASQRILDLYALKPGLCTQSADIKSAFLIGKDPGKETEDGDRKPVTIRPPPEAQPFFDAWYAEQSPATQAEFPNGVRVAVLIIRGNLYGRQTAGAIFRDEFEEIMKKMDAFELVPGNRDATVYVRTKTKLGVIRHEDDVRTAGSAEGRKMFFKMLRNRVPLKEGLEESPGTQIDVLGKTRYRLEDAIITVPNRKYTDNFLAALGVAFKAIGED